MQFVDPLGWPVRLPRGDVNTRKESAMSNPSGGWCMDAAIAAGRERTRSDGTGRDERARAALPGIFGFLPSRHSLSGRVQASWGSRPALFGAARRPLGEFAKSATSILTLSNLKKVRPSANRAVGSTYIHFWRRAPAQSVAGG